MRTVCERFAPEWLPKLEELIPTLPRGPADDREDEEQRLDDAAMTDTEVVRPAYGRKKALPKRVRIMDDRTLVRKEHDEYPPIVRTMVRLLVAFFLYDHAQVAPTRGVLDDLLTELHARRPDGGRPLAQQHGHDGLIAAAAQLQMRVYERLQAGAQEDLLTGLRERQRRMLTVATRASNTHAQSVLTVAIAQTLVAQRRYTQACELLDHAAFPSAEKVSSPVHARYLYYRGRLAALHLRYSEAVDFLEHSLRMCPADVGHGFRQAVLKALCVSQLSLGTIPRRGLFNHPDPRAREGLKPYLELARCVRGGDVLGFEAILASQRHTAAYARDGLLAPVQRLKESVLRTGLRRLSLAYARVTVADVARSLHIPSLEDAELMIMKAIHDGVIVAHFHVDDRLITTPVGRGRYPSVRPRRELLKRAAMAMEVQAHTTASLRFPAVSAVEE